MPRSSPPPRLSAKKHKALQGKNVYSTIRKRGGKPKPRNAKRKRSEFARCFHSAERVEWIQRRCCVACGIRGCENAHVSGDGIGRRAGYDKIIPLCQTCHRLQHQIGAGSFAIRFNLNLRAVAEATERAWQAFSTTAGTDV